ncbi:MAG: hypothetical protein P4L84_22610 [Isosphaeraceae bacterium]|nr:hypothetical protein [Isosphaeraceae bacterium]
MRRQRKFSPSASWSLEPRIALSHASPVAEITHLSAAQQINHATFQGPYTTTVQFGVDTESAVAKLSGSARFPTVGMVSLSGSLSNNVVFPSHKTGTTGTLTFTSPKYPGETVVLQVSGPYANLAPTHAESIHLSVTVESAPSSLSAYIGRQGTAVLKLGPAHTSSGGTSQTHTSAGSYTLVLSQ